MRTEGHLYEATRTDFWGAGFVIAQAATISKENITGDNVLGEELEKPRDEYLSEEQS